MPAAAATPPPSDHHPAVGVRTPATARVESLGHVAQLCAPGHVLLEALLGLLRDADPVAARLLAKAGDAAGRRAFLLLGRGPDVDRRQRSENDNLVVLDRDLHPREPAVREPSGKPTCDRSELFLVHNYKITLQQSPCQVWPPRSRGGGAQSAPVGATAICPTSLSC